MSGIQVLPVRTPREKNIFLTFPWRIYQNDPIWVPPLLPERRKALDPQRNAFLHGQPPELFIAWQGKEAVGTICCADDPSAHAMHPWKDGVIGFFECLDDYAIAQALFDQAADWASTHHLDALYGPFNLNYEDSYGVLIEGRDRPPAALCGHTPPYYQTFFERYGFEPARGDNLAFAVELNLHSPAAQKLERIAERVRQRGHFRVRSADLNLWADEVDRVYGLINRALAHLPGFIPWQRDNLQALLASFRAIADPDLVLFAERVDNGETVGWFPAIPNLNEALIHVNGLRAPWNYVQLYWYTRRRPACLAIKSVLVPPEYWDTGVAVLLFDEMAKRAAAKGYQWVDLSLTSDDNPRTPLLARHMGARIYKRYRVYRKWLSPRSAV